MKNFYMVYATNSQTPPRVKHGDESLAIGEAKRLAKLNPDKEFYVLKAIGRAIKTDVMYEEL